MSKILILGFDGLDYYLVKKFQLKNLMLKEYGKIDISEFVYAATPLIWASFFDRCDMGEKVEKNSS